MAFRSRHISERPASSVQAEQEAERSASTQNPMSRFGFSDSESASDARASHVSQTSESQASDERPMLETNPDQLSPAMLSYRDEMVVRAVGKQKGWNASQTEKALAYVRSDREKYFSRIEQVYEQEVKPLRHRAPSIKEWVAQHPHEIAFQFENEVGEIQSKVLPRHHAQASHYEIYHGVLMRRVPASETLFPPPSELFHQSEKLDEQATEEAFKHSPETTQSAQREAADEKSMENKESAAPFQLATSEEPSSGVASFLPRSRR